MPLISEILPQCGLFASQDAISLLCSICFLYTLTLFVVFPIPRCPMFSNDICCIRAPGFDLCLAITGSNSLQFQFYTTQETAQFNKYCVARDLRCVLWLNGLLQPSLKTLFLQMSSKTPTNESKAPKYPRGGIKGCCEDMFDCLIVRTEVLEHQ